MNTENIINDVSLSLNDTDNVRWTIPALISFLNDGCLILCKTQPGVNAKTVTLTLQDGTEQTAGANSLGILNISRTVPTGRALRRIDEALLDAVLPLWHSKPTSSDTREFIIDTLVKNRFWVYPPANAGSMIEAVIVKKPNVVSDIVDPFPLDDEYISAIKAYMLHRAYAIDTGVGSTQKSQLYLSSFYAAIGAAQQQEANSGQS